MTDKQLQKIRDDLYYKYYGDECRIIENLKMPITKKDERLFEELYCIEMINSCLAYGVDPFEFDDYRGKSWMTDYEKTLGKRRVKQLYKMQVEEFSKATIISNSYTDSEGCSYNSVRFADEN